MLLEAVVPRAAAHKITPKLKSLSAGKMGYGTTEVGDLVVEAL